MKEHVQKPQSMNYSDLPDRSVTEILHDLIRFPSVTPASGEIFDYLEEFLRPLGFQCERFVYKDSDGEKVENLFARVGQSSPHFCFAGHVDVVPPGDEEAWENQPFEPIIKNNMFFGRGAVDMKGAIAAFLSSLATLVKQDKIKGSLSLLITGDEEGPGTYGTQKVLEVLSDQNNIPDYCLVGEPTSEKQIADTVKIGRRGSLTGQVTVKGKQGHVAYPHKAHNPFDELIGFLNELKDIRWDEGEEYFQPTNLEIISLGPLNPVNNVIPDKAYATFNIRYNMKWTRQKLIDKIDELKNRLITKGEINFNTGSNPFYSGQNDFVGLVTSVVEKEVGQKPCLSTSGGTSDARFIHNFCPVVELGLINKTAHQVNENTSISDLQSLQKIYQALLLAFFEERRFIKT